MRYLAITIAAALIMMTGCSFEEPNPGFQPDQDAFETEQPDAGGADSDDVGTDTDAGSDSDGFTDSDSDGSDTSDTDSGDTATDTDADTRSDTDGSDTDGGDVDPVCGNNILELGEQCEPSTNGCNSDCELMSGQSAHDGMTWSWEWTCKDSECLQTCKRLILPANAPDGRFTINSRSDLDFVGDYCEFVGNIRAGEQAPVDFTQSNGSALALERIEGSLRIDPYYVESVSGLNSLKNVTGSVEFVDARINNIGDFDKQPAAHTFSLRALKDIQGIGRDLRFKVVQGTLVDFGGSTDAFDKLEHVGRNFYVVGIKAPQPRDFPEFATLEWIGGSFTLVTNIQNFRRVSGFNSLLYVDGLSISGWEDGTDCESGTTLESVTGFRALTYIGEDLRITWNDGLENIEEFPITPNENETLSILGRVAESEDVQNLQTSSDRLYVDGEVHIYNNHICSTMPDYAQKCRICESAGKMPYDACMQNTGNGSGCHI